jgi:hypothetical protein
VRVVKLLVHILPSRPATRLIPCLALLGLLALLLRDSDSLANAGLFQSGLPTPAELATLTPTETLAPTSAPLATATLPGTGSLPSATWTVLPQPTPEATMTALASPTVPPQSAGGTTLEPNSDEEPRYPGEKAKLRLRLRTLFDSLALGVSYLWLACGIGLMVLLAVALTWVWLEGRHSSER